VAVVVALGPLPQGALAVVVLVMRMLARSHQWLELMGLVAEVAVGHIQQAHIQMEQMVAMVLLS
jgi:hypothetical protein